MLDILPNLKVEDVSLPPSCSAKNLGVIFDSAMNMEANINVTFKSAFHEI